MQRFHDSRLHGVRLVCRLRRTSATPASASGPSGAVAQRDPSTSPHAAAEGPDIEAEREKEGEASGQSIVIGGESAGPEENVRLNERYFIVKSLTLQDLELSVKNGIWATQAHNEESLNKAYEASENVYLIFSANKSGEYFGYARMTSPISKDPAEFMKTIPTPENTVESGDGPKSIPTPATEWAPKGKIIDDSARGTIFWEADLSDEEGDSPHGSIRQTLDGTPEDVEGTGSEQIWGKPFKIEWISTNRLPFYRTRGLRNPWNANREVKIARDGTELETNVGKRLVQMFHRLGPGAGPSVGNPVMGALV